MGTDTKGDRRMKQAVLTIGALAVATGILVAMVLYTVGVMRAYELRILTGDQYSILNQR